MVCFTWEKKQKNGVKMSNKELYRRQVAREILNIIEEISFSDEYKNFRINNGSNGQRDLIINIIKERYNIK